MARTTRLTGPDFEEDGPKSPGSEGLAPAPKVVRESRSVSEPPPPLSPSAVQVQWLHFDSQSLRCSELLLRAHVHGRGGYS